MVKTSEFLRSFKRLPSEIPSLSHLKCSMINGALSVDAKLYVRPSNADPLAAVYFNVCLSGNLDDFPNSVKWCNITVQAICGRVHAKTVEEAMEQCLTLHGCLADALTAAADAIHHEFAAL